MNQPLINKINFNTKLIMKNPISIGHIPISCTYLIIEDRHMYNTCD